MEFCAFPLGSTQYQLRKESIIKFYQVFFLSVHPLERKQNSIHGIHHLCMLFAVR